MGVDFYSCSNCEEVFSDMNDESIYCEGCGYRWCSLDCAEYEGIQYNEEEDYYENCNYCRNEDFEDGILLSFACERLKVSRQELVNMYRCMNCVDDENQDYDCQYCEYNKEV
jgi:DNA-directed RNA polymerase subunit RPC12/RpoP